MRILLIEDDLKLGFMLEYKLGKLYSVDWAKNAEEAEAYIEFDQYDMYILDWMLPGKNGLQFCKELRAKNDKTAILMLTARGEIDDKVAGLNIGADDYLVKPFEFDELFARINALDRSKQPNGYKMEYHLGNLSLNLLSHEVIREGKLIALTNREFKLLVYFIRNAGHALSRIQILNNVWGSETMVTLNAVDAVIKLLRKKIDMPFEHEMIQSIRGFGYRLTSTEENNDV
jgi:DNA-binding response OmpR family regulator